MARLLIVDDDSAMLRLLRALLESDHEVTEANDGQEAMDRIHRETFDLVITDVIMPRRDGLELIREIRDKAPKTRIIALTGGGSMQNMDVVFDAAVAFGAVLAVRKPFDRKDFMRAVTESLQFDLPDSDSGPTPPAPQQFRKTTKPVH